MHLAVAILRTQKGLDYSDVLAAGTDSSDLTKEIKDNQLNGSAGEQIALAKVLESNESLHRIGSGNFTGK